MVEQLEGVVESITYQNNEGSFVVFRLRYGADNRLVSVVSKSAAPFIGEHLRISGEWVEHERFGRQFKADNYVRMPVTSAAGIERFLASGAVKGIGPIMAARIVKRFGEKTLDILEFMPKRLVEIEGIGQKKAKMIGKAYVELAEIREIMIVLESHGISGGYAHKIYAKYGPLAADIVQKNPYRLAAEVDGIGFRTADHIAMSIGIDAADPARVASGIRYALLNTAQAGHCCVPEELLIEETAKLLAVERPAISQRLQELMKNGELITEDYHGMVLLYPEYLWCAERSVAERLIEIKHKAKAPDCSDYDAVVDEWERNAGLNLAKAQREALVSSLKHGVLVLTGGPGTGKTTTIKGILAVLSAMRFTIMLAAPTGRAAKRLSETTGREAVTVHRLLEAAGGGYGNIFGRNEDNPLDTDVVIIDEVSMMDISLMSGLLQAIPNGCRVVLSGDVDQLPAVGPGSVLKDIIRSEMVSVIRLTEVFRQAEESIIVRNAHKINRGRTPDCNETDEFLFEEIASDNAVAARIVELCREELPDGGYDIWHDVQVLSPMHRYDCGVGNLNRLLQAALNPPREGQMEAVAVNQVFRCGDKVMQMKNNYNKGVFNGDIGYVIDIEPDRLLVRYPEGDVVYERGEYLELNLAYAMSVHKSQGSEYPVVIIPLVASHRVMLQRSLLYTAVTRAKERVILVGSKAALNTAAANDRTRKRYSLLAERLRGMGLC